MSTLDEPVRISEYQGIWREWFSLEQERLSAALEVPQFEFEHVGSTAVPGLPAKPIIDIMIGAKKWPLEKRFIERLICLGYDLKSDEDVPELIFLTHRSRNSFNIHLVPFGGTHWVSNIALRSYLTDNKEARTRYSNAKYASVSKGANTFSAYSNAKAPILRSLLMEARNYVGIR